MPKLRIPNQTRAAFKKNKLWRGALAACERAFTEHRHAAALDDAVRITARWSWEELDPWIREGLGRRAREEMLGLRKAKAGRRTDFHRDSRLFDAVQERRDAHVPFKVAVPEAVRQLRSQGEHVTQDALIKIYRRHRKLVKRATIRGLGSCWIPKSNVYLLGDSVGLPPKK